MVVPFFDLENDPGSNFTSLLRKVGLDPFSYAHSGDGQSLQAPHGTTVLAVRYNDGVVMAGDRRATMGSRIANREMEKVVAADRHSGVAISGTAGVAMDMIKIFQLQLEHFEKLDGRPISLEGRPTNFHNSCGRTSLGRCKVSRSFPFLPGTTCCEVLVACGTLTSLAVAMKSASLWPPAQVVVPHRQF